MAEKTKQYLQFWRVFLAEARNAGVPRLMTREPVKTYALKVAGEVSGLDYVYRILTDSAGVSVEIETGEAERNQEILRAWQAHRAAIEGAFGTRLVWEIGGAKSRTAIGATLRVAGLEDDGSWRPTSKVMLTTMQRLEQALQPYIAQLAAGPAPGRQ